MRTRRPVSIAAFLYVVAAVSAGVCQEQSAVQLPSGVKAVWDLSKAHHETTPTRERICINGLWRWQPAETNSDQPPIGNWGYFKVPGNWPISGGGRLKNSQRVYAHPSWKAKSPGGIATAWYQREISVPNNWAGRRIALSLEYLNSKAEVYVDGKKAGEILFPAGELDLTPMCSPGSKHVLSMKVTALPLRDVVAVFSDSNAPRQSKAAVARRGLCGDVYLLGEPSGARIGDVKVITSFRKGQITFNTALEKLEPSSQYALRAVITDKGSKITEFNGKWFKGDDLKDGRIAVTESWKPEKLWDVHTPQNMYDVTVSLLQGGDRLLDTALPEHFGFREFWIDGRDFYLNGSRIFLSLCPYDNANTGAAWANYEAAKESMLRLQSFGINFIPPHNFSCAPGAHLGFAEILRAADDVGMLISLSQPHFGEYEWEKPDADQSNGYAHHAEFYARVAQNHPSVVCYATSHNATGYTDDMNPDMIDGIANPRSPRAQETADRALRAEAIIRRLDPSRVIYHHSSGNLGSMHTSNFYSNWLAIQEMEDWFEHWATQGVKPMMMCEFGTPWTMDWATYKGWYKGKRSFGTEPVPWEFCLAEWDAQFLGDQAYRISENDKANLRWEAERFRKGEVWRGGSIPYNYVGGFLGERDPVWAMHIGQEWRAFRTWEVSANCAWNDRPYWHLRDGAENDRMEYTVDWENLQRPGFSPDYAERYGRMDLDPQFPRSDWIATPAAQAIIRNDGPLLAYIGGKPVAFTSKDHNFLAGETVEKQLIIINNCRETISCDCRWSLNLPQAATGSKTVSVPTGRQERIPLRFDLRAGLAPGKYELSAAVKFSNGETQKDSFAIHVLAPAAAAKPAAEIALWDPKGETGKLLDGLGVKYEPVNAGNDFSGYEILIVGKAAFTPDGPGPNVTDVSKGLKVIVFEQTAEALEKRFGFRAVEYGLRYVFPRVANHPLLAGLDVDHLRDWRGAATILPPRRNLETNDRVFAGAPTVKWCDIPVTRIWRCGNRGNVASVLVEKPARGNFLPIVDGGYSLQYSPLMEYREGKGTVLFCQMDVTGRTETDPAAQRLARNILSYVAGWKPAATRQALYAGDPAGRSHLEKVGVSAASYQGGKLSPDQVLIVGPNAGQQLSANAAAIGEWLKTGGRLLAIGLDQTNVESLLPGVTMRKAEHIAAYFEPFVATSPLAGVGPADVHNRDPQEFSLVSAGATVVGDGVLAATDGASVVLCQLVPWHFDYSKERHNVKQTFRRASFLVTRLLGNLGVEGATPVLARFNSPLDAAKAEKRWLDGLYLDQPEEWDDPYRFFRW